MGGLYLSTKCRHYYCGVLLIKTLKLFQRNSFGLRKQLVQDIQTTRDKLNFFPEPREWTVYPQTDLLRFRLVIRDLTAYVLVLAQSGEELPPAGTKLIQDSGRDWHCTQESVSITIFAAMQPRQGQENLDFQPKALTLYGSYQKR